MKTNLANFLKLTYRKAAKRAKAANHCKIALQKQNKKIAAEHFQHFFGEPSQNLFGVPNKTA